MPIYEYQCEKCGHHLEALQKLSDKPLRECPECGRHRLKRLMSAPLFRLAGSGWYETDFKSEQETKRNLADRNSEAPSEKKEATEVVAKPEEKAAKPEAVDKPAAKSAPRAKSTKPAATRPAARKRVATAPKKKRR